MESPSKEKDREERSEKSQTFEIFINKPEVRRFVNDQARLHKYTKQGIQDLLLFIWLVEDSDKKALSKASKLLAKLAGKYLKKLSSIFKLKPKGRF